MSSEIVYTVHLRSFMDRKYGFQLNNIPKNYIYEFNNCDHKIMGL